MAAQAAAFQRKDFLSPVDVRDNAGYEQHESRNRPRWKRPKLGPAGIGVQHDQVSSGFWWLRTSLRQTLPIVGRRIKVGDLGPDVAITYSNGYSVGPLALIVHTNTVLVPRWIYA